jgi:hypothetical protein
LGGAALLPQPLAAPIVGEGGLHELRRARLEGRVVDEALRQEEGGGEPAGGLGLLVLPLRERGEEAAAC